MKVKKNFIILEYHHFQIILQHLELDKVCLIKIKSSKMKSDQCLISSAVILYLLQIRMIEIYQKFICLKTIQSLNQTVIITKIKKIREENWKKLKKSNKMLYLEKKYLLLKLIQIINVWLQQILIRLNCLILSQNFMINKLNNKILYQFKMKKI